VPMRVPSFPVCACPISIKLGRKVVPYEGSLMSQFYICNDSNTVAVRPALELLNVQPRKTLRVYR
jgi:hypothetical protein